MSSVIKASNLNTVTAPDVYLVDADEVLKAQLGIVEEVVDREPVGPSIDELAQIAAREIIEAARREGEAIVASANGEADEIREGAHEAGLQVGLAEVEAQRAELVGEFRQAVEAVDARFDEFWASVEPDVVRLTLDMARKVVGHEIEENNEFVLNTVKAGLRQLRERQELKVRVNPSDYEFLRSKRDDILGSYDGIRSLEIMDDRRVERGGCLIESTNGSLDARIETQFAEIERAVREIGNDEERDVAA